MDIYELISLLNSYSNGIPITYFKNKYKPIELADMLKTFKKAGLITIDWKNGKILSVSSELFNEAFKDKTMLTKKESKIPDYMRDEKIGRNKPFIPKK